MQDVIFLVVTDIVTVVSCSKVVILILVKKIISEQFTTNIYCRINILAIR